MARHLGRRDFLFGVLALHGAACTRSREIVVLHAASLRRVFADAAREYERLNPGIRVRLEPSGSQVAIRKVTESGARADVVAVADAALIDRMMIPGHAAWNLRFATNEIVLAHLPHSRFTEELDTRTWPEVLLRPEVRLGRVDPNLAPLGYHTVFAWQLAESSGRYGREGLAKLLLGKVSPERLAADETELLAALESRAVDYAFVYRSTAEDHRLKWVALPDEINLSRPEYDAMYSVAGMDVRLERGTTRLQGHAIVYGLTIPVHAGNRVDAEKLVAFLLNDSGKTIQRASGFRPMGPARCSRYDTLPAPLRASAAPEP